MSGEAFAFSWEGVGEKKKKTLTIPVLPKDMNWRESMQILRIFCKQSINLKKKTFQSTANICILSHQFRSLSKTMIVRVFFHPPLFPPPPQKKKKKKNLSSFFLKLPPLINSLSHSLTIREREKENDNELMTR